MNGFLVISTSFPVKGTLLTLCLTDLKKVKTVLADLYNYVHMGEKTAKIQKIMKIMHSL